MEDTYLQKAMKAEYLDPATEKKLALAWRRDEDEQALHRLVRAYTRLAISIAGRFRHYNFPMSDLVQEASIGLMKAAHKFDPERGVVFSTYAQWWIRAALQNYVLQHSSVVRVGTTNQQKKLFFNLRRVRAEIETAMMVEGELCTQDILYERIAEKLGVTVRHVEFMTGVLSGADMSLNSPLSEEGGGEWIDRLEADNLNPEEGVMKKYDTNVWRLTLRRALSRLSDRERHVIIERKLLDTPRTLQSLSDELHLSKERVRQIECTALEKLQVELRRECGPQVREMIFG